MVMATETAYVTGEKTLKSTVDTAVREAIRDLDSGPKAVIDVWAGDPLKEGSQEYVFSYEAWGPPEKGTLLTDLQHRQGSYYLKVKQVVNLSSDPDRFNVFVKAVKK